MCRALDGKCYITIKYVIFSSWQGSNVCVHSIFHIYMCVLPTVTTRHTHAQLAGEPTIIYNRLTKQPYTHTTHYEGTAHKRGYPQEVGMCNIIYNNVCIWLHNGRARLSLVAVMK